MFKKLAFMALLLLIALTANAAFAAEPATRGERAEVRFLEGMIDHHQMALDMALDCLEKASSAAVLEICQAVITAQTPEIELMQAWLAEWYNISYSPMSMMEMLGDMAMVTEDDSGDHSGHGGHGQSPMATDPPMMMGMMAGFNRLTGLDYDSAWLESMIDHHDDALHMSERILAWVVHPELEALAQQIIADQTAEIEQMEMLINELNR